MTTGQGYLDDGGDLLEGGQVTSRPVPRVRPEVSAAARGGRRDFTLDDSFTADNPLRIVAGQPIVLNLGGWEFEKYEVSIRDVGAHGYVSLGGNLASSQGGRYDDFCIGGGERSARCEPTRHFSIVFPVAPALPVEIHLYAGKEAEPI